ncbi:MAG: hypothetical protein PHT99_10190 [Methanoregula sp.]|nr:hypothetical protein [Methanoregula sp.]
MNIFRYLLLAALMCAVLTASGCTSSSGPSAPATTVPAAAPSVPLASLALAPSDIPAVYTLTESRQKTAADVSSLALELGWQAGYAVIYTNTSAASSDEGTIVQTITVYPVTGIPGITGVIDKQERLDSDMVFSDIPDPGVGDTSGGYVGKARADLVLKTDFSDPLAKEAAITENRPDVAELWFSKGSIFEVIRITGPGADIPTVTALARTAYAKIP